MPRLDTHTRLRDLSRPLGIAATTVALVVAMVLIAPWRDRTPGVLPANVLLILVDTLRADHLGVYGYERDTSPGIDRLAAKGLVFAQARSVAPWTNPTIAALFTGHHPHSIFDPLPHRQAIHQVIPERLTTLASKLQTAGFATAAFVDHPGISPRLGFARGFDTFVRIYKTLGTPIFQNAPAAELVAEIARHLPALEGQRFFAYVHLIFPHRPYTPPPPYAGRFGAEASSARKEFRQELVNAYDAEIRLTDDVVLSLLEEFTEAGLLDGTWVILTSDHGEGFWEHDRAEHGNSFYDELLRVPLILLPPANAEVTPRRIDAPVSLLDLHSTVLDLAGLAADSNEIEGRSLLRFLVRHWTQPIDDAVSEQPHSGDVRGAALVRWPWKLIRRAEHDHSRLQLYRLPDDPGERTDRSAREGGLAQALDAELARHLAADRARLRGVRAKPEAIELDAETIERLKALGYLR